jgi:hypothetical protein
VRSSKPIEHVFISNDPIEVGRMNGGDKYTFFSALCIALEADDSSRWQREDQERFMQRRNLSLKQHWHSLVKPKCERCEMYQLMLRANVKKADRLTFDRAQFKSLMQRIEAHP